MSTLEYQRVLARMVVDDSFFNHFAQDPVRAAENMGVHGSTQSLLSKMDLEGVTTFREIVQGSRSTTFRLVLDELSSRLTDDEWRDLFKQFHSEVVVKDSTAWNDLREFASWLEELFPLSRGAAIARYQFLVQRLVLARPARNSPGTYIANPKAVNFESAFDFDELFDDRIPLWQIAEKPTTNHFLLVGDYNGGDINVFGVDHRAASLFTVLQKERTFEEVSLRLGHDEIATRAAIDEYVSIGIVEYADL